MTFQEKQSFLLNSLCWSVVYLLITEMGVKLHQVCGGSFQGTELFELKDFLPKDTGWIIRNANYIQQNVEIWNGQHKKNFLKGPHTSTTTANSDILTRTKGVVVDDWEFKIARLVQKNISHSYDCVEKEMGIAIFDVMSSKSDQFIMFSVFFICAVLEVKLGKSQLW